MARYKKPNLVKSKLIKDNLEKNIKALQKSSDSLALFLEQVVDTVDMSKATDKEKAELKQLESDIVFLDEMITKMIGGEE